jgi:hypothetical protein
MPVNSLIAGMVKEFMEDQFAKNPDLLPAIPGIERETDLVEIVGIKVEITVMDKIVVIPDTPSAGVRIRDKFMDFPLCDIKHDRGR